MRTSVFIASVMTMAAMGLGGLVAEHKSFVTQAQEKPASAAEVKIDNFVFGPAAVTVTAGTAAPEASVKLPLMLADTCACASGKNAARSSITRAARNAR